MVATVTIPIILPTSEVDAQCRRLGFNKNYEIKGCAVMGPGKVCYYVIPKIGKGGVSPLRYKDLLKHEKQEHCIEGKKDPPGGHP